MEFANDKSASDISDRMILSLFRAKTFCSQYEIPKKRNRNLAIYHKYVSKRSYSYKTMGSHLYWEFLL